MKVNYQILPINISAYPCTTFKGTSSSKISGTSTLLLEFLENNIILDLVKFSFSLLPEIHLFHNWEFIRAAVDPLQINAVSSAIKQLMQTVSQSQKVIIIQGPRCVRIMEKLE